MPGHPIPPIGGDPGLGRAGFGAQRPEVRRPGEGPDFGELVKDGLEEVSKAENQVDTVAQDIATGGPSEIHDLMMATTQASLSVDLLVQVRNRAVEAYQEIMRMQV